MEWINVEEKFPEDYDEVLLWDNKTDLIYTGFSIGKGTGMKEGFYKLQPDGSTQYLENITHWMELPGPPKKTEEI